jgi:hypothetical protein
VLDFAGGGVRGLGVGMMGARGRGVVAGDVRI